MLVVTFAFIILKEFFSPSSEFGLNLLPPLQRGSGGSRAHLALPSGQQMDHHIGAELEGSGKRFRIDVPNVNITIAVEDVVELAANGPR